MRFYFTDLCGSISVLQMKLCESKYMPGWLEKLGFEDIRNYQV